MQGPILLALGLLLRTDASFSANGTDNGEMTCPQECRCLSLSVDCSNLQLKTFPDNVDAKVQVLNMSGNNFKDVYFPSTLKSVQNVYISNSSLQTIFFDNLPELTLIDLSFNSLTNFSTIQLEKLNSLNISHNKDFELQFCHSDPIGHKLEILDMSFCHVKSLKFLGKLSKLRELHLNGNLIKNMSSGKSTTLSLLNINQGRLSELNVNELLNFPNLLSLDVSSNRNIRIELSFKNKSEYCLPLENFVATSSDISEIKIPTLCKLQRADLSDNEIIIHKTTFYANIELKSLNLSLNKIRNIEHDTFKNNEKLLELDFSQNFIENGVWSEYLKNLKRLNLSSNKVKTLDDMYLINLLYFDVSDNRIISLSTNLSKRFPKLEYLDVSKNLIDSLGPLGLIALKTLILKCCQILTIEPNSLAKLKELQYLDLTGNKLMRLEYIEISSLPNLQTVRLGNNSWHCECSNAEMKDLYIYIAVNRSLTNTDELICNEPKKRSWKEVCGGKWERGEEMPQQSSSLKTAMILLAIFLFTIFFLAALIYIKHRVKKEIVEGDRVMEQPLNAVSPRTGNAPSLRRARSEVSVRQTSPDDLVDNPPSYEEAIRMPPMTELGRMTQSMDAIVERRMTLPTIPE